MRIKLRLCGSDFIKVWALGSWGKPLFALALSASLTGTSSGADLYAKTVEVFNTTVGLLARTEPCAGTSVNKAAGSRGIVISTSPTFCGSYNRWQILWDGDTAARWSAEDWLKVVPPDLTITGDVSVSPNPASPGDELSVTCKIRNRGQGIARPSETAITVYRRSDIGLVRALEKVSTVPLSPGQTLNFSHDVSLPQNLAPGIYFVQIEVDYEHDIEQSDYTNDLKEGDFIVGQAQYTVSATHGTGGTILPGGNQTVSANGNIVFTATPDATYTVDQWFVDGEVKQSGGATFTLSPVTANTTVNVTFRLKTYTLAVDANNADVTISPSLSEYPHGGKVTISVVPNAGRIFVQWNGTLQSLEPSMTFVMDRDVSLVAILRDLLQQPAIRTAHSTPSTFFDIAFPTTDGYIYVLEFSDNNTHWRPLTVTTGHNANEAIHHINTTTGAHGFYRIRQKPYYFFVGGFLKFPIPGGNSETSRISSIADHHGRMGYTKDGAILTYKGHLASVDKFAYGYRTKESSVLEVMSGTPRHIDYFGGFYLAAFGRNSVGADFDLSFNYNDATTLTPGDKGLLFYDGHQGYDYPCDKDTEILSAATGKLIPSLCGGPNNQIVIQHMHGFRTFYLHCDRWTEELLVAKANDEEIDISQGQLIGYVGDKGAASGAYHLHLEVHRYSVEDNAYVLADPYGYFAEDGSQIDPPLWVTGE